MLLSDREAGSPTWLYSIGCAGNLVAALLYVVVVEPALDISDQIWMWQVAAGVLLMGAAAAGPSHGGVPTAGCLGTRDLSGPVLGRWAGGGRWVAGGFVPVCLTLSCTQYLSLDYGSLPIVWLMPFATYLLAMALAFHRKGIRVLRALAPAAPVAVLVLTYALLRPWARTVLQSFILHLVVLFTLLSQWLSWLVGFAPAPRGLPSFYCAIALGGLLATALVHLVASNLLGAAFQIWPANPIGRAVLDTLAPEYLLAVAATALTLGIYPSASRRGAPLVAAWGGVGTGILAFYGQSALRDGAMASRISLILGLVALGATLALLARFRHRLSTLMAVLAIVVANGIAIGPEPPLLHSRSPHGQVRVLDRGNERQLLHGTTFHGSQTLNCAIGRNPVACVEPTSYYTRSGPVGHTLQTLRRRQARLDIVSVGLGVGTMAAYCADADTIRFIEIDPTIVAIAWDLFGFLPAAQARCGSVDVHVGDGRLLTRQLPPMSVDLLVLDAFSSDTIPQHLLTSEAMLEAGRALRSEGVVAIHTSSRYFDLASVVVGTATSVAYFAIVASDGQSGARMGSQWVFLGKSRDVITAVRQALSESAGHVSAVVGPGTEPRRRPIWTDERHSILDVLRPGGRP